MIAPPPSFAPTLARGAAPAETPTETPSTLSMASTLARPPAPSGGFDAPTGIAPTVTPDRLAEEQNASIQAGIPTPLNVNANLDNAIKGGQEGKEAAEKANESARAVAFNKVLDAGWDGAKEFWQKELGGDPALDPENFNPRSKDPTVNQTSLATYYKAVVEKKTKNEVVAGRAKAGAAVAAGADETSVPGNLSAKDEGMTPEFIAGQAAKGQANASRKQIASDRNAAMLEKARIDAAGRKAVAGIKAKIQAAHDAKADEGILVSLQEGLDNINTAKTDMDAAAKEYNDAVDKNDFMTVDGKQKNYADAVKEYNKRVDDAAKIPMSLRTTKGGKDAAEAIRQHKINTPPPPTAGGTGSKYTQVPLKPPGG